MKILWSYDKNIYHDKKGERWHFVTTSMFIDGVDYSETPYELYFRNDSRTEFGLLRYEKKKDNPYRNYEMIINKILKNSEFRTSLINPDTQEIWKSNWK